MPHMLFLIFASILVCMSLIPLSVLLLGLCSGPIIVRSAILEALAETARREEEQYAHRQGTEAQPAYKLYVAGRGWSVAGYIARYLFVYVRACSKKWMEQAAVARYVASRNLLLTLPALLLVIGLQMAARLLYLSAPLSALLFLPLYSVALFCWMICTQVGLVVLSLFYFGRTRSIPLCCPHCYQAMPIPIYLCPTCGAEHSRLWPNGYGLLAHRCIRCKTSLPTLDVLSRHRLASLCPWCHHGLPPRLAESAGVHIALVGATAAGKTSYLMTAIQELRSRHANWKMIFIDTTLQQRFEDAMSRFKRGQTLIPTKEIVPSAYTLKIQRPGRRSSRVLYLYDPAGAAFEDDIQAGKQAYYKYSNGIILVIDPLSLPGWSQTQDRQSVDTLMVMQTYERVMKMLEIHVGISRRYRQPIAVVVSKVDLFELNNEIGLPAVRIRTKYDPSIRSEAEVLSQLVRAFLCKQGLKNLVYDLELSFEHIRYFSCSALGRTPAAKETREFESDRTLDPLLWVLQQQKVL